MVILSPKNGLKAYMFEISKANFCIPPQFERILRYKLSKEVNENLCLLLIEKSLNFAQQILHP